MLTEKLLLELGKKCQTADEEQVRVECVKDGAQDAIVRIGKERILVVSENDEGRIRSVFGKNAQFIEHGKWEMTSSNGRKQKLNLLGN